MIGLVPIKDMHTPPSSEVVIFFAYVSDNFKHTKKNANKKNFVEIVFNHLANKKEISSS